MVDFKSIFKKVLPAENENDTEDENVPTLSYSHVPLTIALRKRKYEEEQFAKYGLHKEKICELL